MAFSCSRSQLDKVYQCIKIQAEHHRKRSFREEYVEFMKRYEVKYRDSFLFEFFE